MEGPVTFALISVVFIFVCMTVACIRCKFVKAENERATDLEIATVVNDAFRNEENRRSRKERIDLPPAYEDLFAKI